MTSRRAWDRQGGGDAVKIREARGKRFPKDPRGPGIFRINIIPNNPGEYREGAPAQRMLAVGLYIDKNPPVNFAKCKSKSHLAGKVRLKKGPPGRLNRTIDRTKSARWGEVAPRPWGRSKKFKKGKGEIGEQPQGGEQAPDPPESIIVRMPEDSSGRILRTGGTLYISCPRAMAGVTCEPPGSVTSGAGRKTPVIVRLWNKAELNKRKVKKVRGHALVVALKGWSHTGAPGIKHNCLLQSTMGRNKDKEKSKRLYEVTPNKEVSVKMARTEEVPGKAPEAAAESGPPLMTDLMDSQDIPTTPSQTEKSFGRGIVPDSQPSQLGLEEQMEMMHAPESGREPGGEPSRAVPAPLAKEPSFGSPKGEKQKGVECTQEEILDWRIPATFRLDWVMARVDQMLIQLDVVGGLYEPVFIVEATVKKEVRDKPVGKEASPYKTETPSFFKIRIKNKKTPQAAGAEEGRGTTTYPREEMNEEMIKHIESLNQMNGTVIITNCLDMLKQIRKVRAKQNSFASRASGKARAEKLWNYGLRKLVHLAGDLWGMHTALPVLPLIKSYHAGAAEITVHDSLLNNFEDSLIKAFAACEDEQSRDLAIDYWTSIVESQSAVSGKIRYGSSCISKALDSGGPVVLRRSFALIIRGNGLKRAMYMAPLEGNPESHNRIKSTQINTWDIASSQGEGGKGGGEYGPADLNDNREHPVIKLNVAIKARGGKVMKGGSVAPAFHAITFRMSRGGVPETMESSSSRLLLSEKMADLLFKELVGTSTMTKEDKIRLAEACMRNLEALQSRIGDLIMRGTKGQGSPEFRGLAMEGSKQLSKDVDAQMVVLRESIKYLEGKNTLPPSFRHIYAGTDSALLPAVAGVWDRKDEAAKGNIMMDLLLQEFWEMFFREAKGALCYPGWLNVAGTHPRGLKLGRSAESVQLDSNFGSPPNPSHGGGASRPIGSQVGAPRHPGPLNTLIMMRPTSWTRTVTSWRICSAVTVTV